MEKVLRIALAQINTTVGDLKANTEKIIHFISQEIVLKRFNPELVKNVIQMVDKNEYKRRQAPPGIKITPKAFGEG